MLTKGMFNFDDFDLRDFLKLAVSSGVPLEELLDLRESFDSDFKFLAALSTIVSIKDLPGEERDIAIALAEQLRAAKK